MNELLNHFRSPTAPIALWPDKPVTIGNLLRQAIQNGWLLSSTPFGPTLRGPETVWKETLQLTSDGERAIIN